jgi:hypothetical protein
MTYMGDWVSPVDNSIPDSDAVAPEEKNWGFGQIFPVILLFLPLMSIWESFAGKYRQLYIQSDLVIGLLPEYLS